MDDFRYRFRIPASGDTVPDSLKRIIVEVEIAGRRFTQNLPAAPHQVAEFVWDNRDALDNIVMNSVNARVRIGFVYDTLYSAIQEGIVTDYNILSSWALPGGNVTLLPGRAEQVMWKEYEYPMSALSAGIIRSGLGSGWTLTPHHGLITGRQPILVRGDGTQRRVHGGQDLVWTVAGNGTAGFSGDGGPAEDAQLYWPKDVAVGPDGTLYIADYANCRIRAVTPDGNITTVAGSGISYVNPDNFNEGGPAVEAALPGLQAVEIGPDGLLYMLVWGPGGQVVRRIDRDGNITTVAGLNADPSAECLINGTASPGDGGPANDATLCSALDIFNGPDSSIYISQGHWGLSGGKLVGSNVIRKVGPDGIIQTIAGAGPEAGSNTQTDSGMPAYEAGFALPAGLNLDKDGNLLMADFHNRCVRSLGTDGIIRTVGGQCNSEHDWGWPPGEPGEDGDPATEAWPWYVDDVLNAPDGNIYVLCNHYQYSSHIRRIDPDGILHGFAGRFEKDWAGYEGDNGPALDAKFRSHGGKMAIGPKGYVYLADYNNHAVRKIGPLFSPDYPGLNDGEILVPECADCPDFGGMGYIFDQGGKHLRTIDLKTGTVIYTFSYDSNDLLVGIQDRFGSTTTIQRDAGGRAISITGPYGDVTDLTVDSAGNLTGVAYADSTGYTLGYNSHLLTSKTDPRGSFFSYSYNANGRFISSADPAGGSLTVNRTETGGITTTTLTTAENRVTTYIDRHDSADSFLSDISGWDGAVAQYGRSANRFSSWRTEADGTRFDIKSTTDPITNIPYTSFIEQSTPGGLVRMEEKAVTYGPDTDGDNLADTVTTTRTINSRTFSILRDMQAHNQVVTSPEGRVITTVYDPVTLQIAKETVGGIADIEYQYDADGRLNRMTQGSRQSEYSYAGAYLSGLTDPMGHTTDFGRDALGRVASLTLADGNKWGFVRDQAGNIITITEPDGSTLHRFTYTPVGLLDSYSSPLDATESFKYDKDKLLTRRQYPSGKAVIYDYNVKGQLTQVQTPEGNHGFTYDTTTGLMIQAMSRDGQRLDFTYDGSLLKTAAWTGVVSDTVSYTYNNDLRVSQLSYGSAILPLAYDNDGLLTGVGTITLSRDSGNGLLSGITDGAFSIAYTRNTYGEVATTTATHTANLYNTSTTYDALGRISEKVETIAGVTHTWSYEYDAVGQLIQVSMDSVAVEDYGYDAVGNRVSVSNTLTGMNLGNSDFTYDADNKLLSAGATSYTYDADGRLHQVQEAAGTTTYHYNTDGTLAQVDLPDGRQITYLYDHRGRRIARAVDGTRTHVWLYGDGLMPLAEYDGSGVLQKTFVYAAGPVPVAYIQGGNTFHIVTDHLGSPRLVVDSTGAIVKRINYDSFGNVISDSNPGLYLCFGFAGGMADPDHELIRFGARDYQPSTGRWTAKDPILFKGGFNLYGYVGNDPVNLTDREGTILFFLAWLAGQGFVKFPQALSEWWKAHKLLEEAERRHKNVKCRVRKQPRHHGKIKYHEKYNTDFIGEGVQL